MLPVLFYFLNLPNQGFSIGRFKNEFKGSLEGNKVTFNMVPNLTKTLALPISRSVGGVSPFNVIPALTTTLASMQRSQVVRPIGSLNELNLISLNANARASNEGARVSLKGMFMKFNDNEFDVFKLKRVCCGADATPLRARVVSEKPVQKIEPRTWVQVTGELRFLKSSRCLPELCA